MISYKITEQTCKKKFKQDLELAKSIFKNSVGTELSTYSSDTPDGIGRQVFYCPIIDPDPPEKYIDKFDVSQELFEYSFIDENKTLFPAIEYPFNLISSLPPDVNPFEAFVSNHYPVIDIDWNHKKYNRSRMIELLYKDESCPGLSNYGITIENSTLVKSNNGWHLYVSQLFTFRQYKAIMSDMGELVDQNYANVVQGRGFGLLRKPCYPKFLVGQDYNANKI